MAAWEDIEPTLTRLRDFVFTDLGRLASQRSGGQFAVVALVAAARDALARLRHGKNQGHRVFELCLPPEWRPAARTLYGALRHGLIHAYEPKAVIGDGSPVTFEVAWQGHRHLTFPDENRDALCIVAPRLVDGLRDAFAAVEAELRADPKVRAAFLNRDRKERVVEQHGPSELAAWRQAVESRRSCRGHRSRPTGSARTGRTWDLAAAARAAAEVFVRATASRHRPS